MADERTEGEEEKLIPRAVMAGSPHGESIIAAVNSKSDDSNLLKQSDRSAYSSSTTKNSNTAAANKARSCKGCLYYSSRFKADSRNPLCVGLTRSLPNAFQLKIVFLPDYILGQSEAEASTAGRNLREFRYACVGYSLYEDRKSQASNGQQSQTELPFCVGLEVLVDQRVKTADSASLPAHVHNKDVNGLPQRKSPKPTTATGEEFLSRFTRNANLVANGVAKNIRKVGNQIKQSLDDIMYRRPK
ncbi:hypothetical protein OROHE_000553 [Orobanche hederae]